MTARYVMFAAYNRWANRRLYDAAAKLSDADYRTDRGAFFKSVHGTRNHVLVADRLWMRRFTGEGDVADRLDAVLHEDLSGLRTARETEDERIIHFIGTLTEADLTGHFRYRTIVQPMTVEQERTPVLDHVFNHQTHHRGQVHCLLTGIAGDAPSLDLVLFHAKLEWPPGESSVECDSRVPDAVSAIDQARS